MLNLLIVTSILYVLLVKVSHHCHAKLVFDIETAVASSSHLIRYADFVMRPYSSNQWLHSFCFAVSNGSIFPIRLRDSIVECHRAETLVRLMR